MAIHNYRRPLDKRPLAENFVRYVLGIDDNYAEIAKRIESAELSLAELEAHPTITHDDHRTAEYRSPENREKLRNQILSELITEKRLENDEMIRLGCGGACPEQIKDSAQAYIISGAPASGKSSIASRIASENGAFILDSDYAKRKFPEYLEYEGGASLVHQESDSIVFAKENSLLEYCVYQKYNIVIPLVGRTEKSINEICNKLRESEYHIHIINVALDRQKCAVRAYRRYIKTNRYVPLSYVFDEVGNEPERIYFVLKRSNNVKNIIESFAQFSTDTAIGQPPILLEATDNSPVSKWLK